MSRGRAPWIAIRAKRKRRGRQVYGCLMREIVDQVCGCITTEGKEGEGWGLHC